MPSQTVLLQEKNNTSTFYKVLPLGDSRVEGATINSVSYRYDLWKYMIIDHWHFDFIGSQYDRSNYPEFMGKKFDPDHEGIGGFKTQDILDNIDNIIEKYGVPDVVLLGIGGNDLTFNVSVSTAIDNINKTIDILQKNNSNITIFIERIAPGRTSIMTPEIMVTYNAFNTSITNLAKEQTTDLSKIIIVDMSINWSDDYLKDNVHYSHKGAKEVADRYYQAMEEALEH